MPRFGRRATALEGKFDTRQPREETDCRIVRSDVGQAFNDVGQAFSLTETERTFSLTETGRTSG
jgi:hypothetical protein